MPRQKITDKAIEQKYESGFLRLNQERNDFLLPQILDFVKTNKWINLHPEYQRRLVWDKKKRSQFIESLLMNIPIPPVFLFESEYSRYEVMDGQQRLSTIVDFYENRFKLSGLEKWPELNGKNYSDCPPVIQRGLDRRRISAVIVLAENLALERDKFDIRRMVFKRLNTGGQNLIPQEIRNCLFSGPFNDLLVELAGNDLFDDLWEIPRYSEHIRGSHISSQLADNALFKRMRDCEIVLRFFAFSDSSNIRGAVVDILDRCMKGNLALDKEGISNLRVIFLEALETCRAVFGEKTFRLKNEEGKYLLSQPLYDAQMVAINKLKEFKDVLVKKRIAIQNQLETALRSEELYELVVGRPNTSAAIKDRLAQVEQIIRKAAL